MPVFTFLAFTFYLLYFRGEIQSFQSKKHNATICCLQPLQYLFLYQTNGYPTIGMASNKNKSGANPLKQGSLPNPFALLGQKRSDTLVTTTSPGKHVSPRLGADKKKFKKFGSTRRAAMTGMSTSACLRCWPRRAQRQRSQQGGK